MDTAASPATPPSAPGADPAPTTSLRAVDLERRFGRRRVVAGVSLSVSGGEVVGLLGRNGAGKTTTFYMIVGLIRPTAGRVLLHDEDVTHLRMHQRARHGIGYLPQEPSVFRKLTVAGNLLAIAETLPLSRDARHHLADRLLADLGLSHLSSQPAYTLSGGERRRLEIARALVTQPRFLLLDEPFSGVDPISVADVQQIVVNLRARGIGILITDHNVRETLRIVDRAYLIDEGRILSEGSSRFLIDDPQARRVYLGENFDL